MENLSKNVIISITDTETGEILAETEPKDLVKSLLWKDTYKRRKVIRNIYGDKIMVFQRILKKVSNNKILTEGELRVFSYFLGVMDFENWINIPQKEIANETGLNIRTVKKAIKKLKEKGYIQVLKKGRDNFYRVDPSVAWKGTERQHFKVITGQGK